LKNGQDFSTISRKVFMNRPRIISLFLIVLFAAGVTSGQKLEQNASEPTAWRERANSCASERSMLLNFVAWSGGRQSFHEVPIWQLPDSRAFFFVSGMTIDADGAPNAYNPDDTGLDELTNAGGPTHWDGIIADTDPTRYVDASKIPYVVLPNEAADAGGARLGDFAVVMNLRNGKSSYAIYADIGTMGEGSIALADNLGIWSDPREGGQSDAVLYLVFPGSGNLRPRAIDDIQSETENLLQAWGGIEKLASCAQNQSPDAATATLDTAAEN
jgi:hypothetical protein